MKVKSSRSYKATVPQQGKPMFDTRQSNVSQIYSLTHLEYITFDGRNLYKKILTNNLW